ncbi:MAG: HPr(Ser) kinase/phosphatase [Candidatus Nanopelagicales bacterium]
MPRRKVMKATAAEVPSYSVPLSDIVDSLSLMRVAGGQLDLTSVRVSTSEVNRPGLQLTGFTEHFNPGRLQIIGWTETAYLSALDPATRAQRLDAYFALEFPALIVARGLHVMPDMVEAADRHDVPVLVTDVQTSQFAGALNWYLIHELAPRQTVHAGLVDVYGEGVLILAEQAVGASETALELVRRGHRLISDSEVEVLRISEQSLRGRAPQGRGFVIDIPGVGRVDVEELFGIGAIKGDQAISFVVVLEMRDWEKEYERVGIDEHFQEVLGVPVPKVTVPVQPGRNLAVIIEAAALNHRLRERGYNAAADINRRITG